MKNTTLSAQAHDKKRPNYPKNFLQKKVFHFFQMKKIVKESPEAVKNRLYDVLPLYPSNRSIATRMASTKRFFSADLLDLRNAHTAKHTDELGNSCAVPYPSFCKLTVFDHPFSST